MNLLLEKIKSKQKIFLTVVAVSVFVAACAAIILPKKYEAKVTVRNATVGQFMLAQAQQNQTGVQAGLIETNTQTLSRLSSPRFYTEALLNSCNLTGDGAAEALSKSLKVTAVKQTTDLISLSYTSKGQETTQKCLHAIIDQLSNAQEDLASGKKRQLLAQLISQKSALVEMEKSEKDLNMALIKNGMSNRSPAESALMLYGIQAKQNIIQEARRVVIELEAALVPPATQKLTALEPIYVSDKPVFPNLWLFSFAGLFLGLFICAGICWREILNLMTAED